MKTTRFLLLGCLAVPMPNQTRVAHFAMAYTADSSWTDDAMSKNLAIPRTVRFLFASKNSPILLNGSLAKLVVELFAAKQEPSRALDTEQQHELDALHDAISSCNADQIEAAQKPINARIHTLMLSTGGLSNEEQKFIVLGKIIALAHQVLSYTPSPPCENFKLENSLGTAGWAEFLAMIESENARDWRIFLLEKSTQKMVLFVPNAYLAQMKTACNNCSDAQSIGLRVDEPNVLKPFGSDLNGLSSLLKNITPNEEYSAANVALSIRSLFKAINTQDPIDLIAYFTGHGSFDPRSQSLVGLRSQTGQAARYAGLPSPEFLNLLQVFQDLSAKVVMWSTCFGGGKNAQTAAQTLYLNEFLRLRQARHTGKPYQTRPFIAISAAPTDLPTPVADSIDFKKFFTDMRTIVVNDVTKATNEQVSAAVKEIESDRPIILLPAKIEPKSVGSESAIGTATGALAAGAVTPKVGGLPLMITLAARQWQLGKAPELGAEDMVIDESLLQTGATHIEVPAQTQKLLIYETEVDQPIHIRADAKNVSLVSRVSEVEIAHLKSLIDDRSIDKIFSSLVGTQSESSCSRFNFYPSDIRGSGAKKSSQFLYDELRIKSSDISWNYLLGLHGSINNNIVLKNVWVIQFPSKFAQRGWVLFTYTDDTGQEWLHAVEMLPQVLGIPVYLASDSELRKASGIYLREVRNVTGNVTNQLKMARETILANYILQGAAINGEVDVAAAFIQLFLNPNKTTFKKLMFTDDPNQILVQRFEKFGLHVTAPDQAGINAAYLNAALVENASALGELTPHATDDTKNLAVMFASNISVFRNMPEKRITLLQFLAQPGKSQNAIDQAFTQAIAQDDCDTIQALACLANPRMFNDSVFTKITKCALSRRIIGCTLDSKKISQQKVDAEFKRLAESFKTTEVAIATWLAQRNEVSRSVAYQEARHLPEFAELLASDPKITPTQAQELLAQAVAHTSNRSNVIQKLLANDKVSVDVGKALIELIKNFYITEKEMASTAQLLLMSGRIPVDKINEALIEAVSGYKLHIPTIKLLVQRKEISNDTLAQALIKLLQCYGTTDQEILTVAQLLLAQNRIPPTKLKEIAQKWNVNDEISNSLKAAFKAKIAPLIPAQKAKLQPAAIKKIKTQLKNERTQLQKVRKNLLTTQKQRNVAQKNLKKARGAAKKKVQGTIKKLNVLITNLKKKQAAALASIKRKEQTLAKAKVH